MRKIILWWYSNLWGVQPVWYKDPFPLALALNVNWNKLWGKPTIESLVYSRCHFFVFLNWQILWMNTLSMKLRSSWSPWPCWSLKVEHLSTRSKAEQRAFIARRHNQASCQQLSMNAATNWLRYDGTRFILSVMMGILATLIKVSWEPHGRVTV